MFLREGGGGGAWGCMDMTKTIAHTFENAEEYINENIVKSNHRE